MLSRFISNANWHISLCFSSFLWTSGQRQILAYTTWGNPFRVATCNVSNGWHYNVPPTSAQNLALNKSTMQVRHLLHCTSNFFVSSRDATLCNVRVCLSVYLRISKTTSKLHQILDASCTCPQPRTTLTIMQCTILYILLVLCMFSYNNQENVIPMGCMPPKQLTTKW